MKAFRADILEQQCLRRHEMGSPGLTSKMVVYILHSPPPKKARVSHTHTPSFSCIVAWCILTRSKGIFSARHEKISSKAPPFNEALWVIAVWRKAPRGRLDNVLDGLVSKIDDFSNPTIYSKHIKIDKCK